MKLKQTRVAFESSTLKNKEPGLKPPVSMEIIPEGLKADKSVAPFIERSVELLEIDPVVSYYLKIYVLEYLLSNKHHTKSKENQEFCVSLLDDTERLKNTEDEALSKILNLKQLSFNAVMSFAYRIFNSSLQELGKADEERTNKKHLISKLRASITFMELLSVFTNEEDESIDFAKVTGGKAGNAKEFENITKQKLRMLKFHLTRILKDQASTDKKHLEKEFESELEKKEDFSNPVTDEEELKRESKSDVVLDAGVNDAKEGTTDTHTKDTEGEERFPPAIENELGLPSAPKFVPETQEEADEPPPPASFLPPQDPLKSRKSSAIKIYPPESQHSSKPGPETHSFVPDTHRHSASLSNSGQRLTKENVSSLLNTADLISKIQKHAKYAISALNYEDLATAEKELCDGLDLLRVIKG